MKQETIERVLLSYAVKPIAPYNQQIIRRLAARTQATTKAGCFNYKFLDANGRARISYGGSPRYAARVLLALCTPESDAAPSALHSCHNPACINPAHLRWGTAKENADDRSAATPRTTWRRITLADVVVIKQMHEQGSTQVSIAKAIGASQVTVCNWIRKIAPRAKNVGSHKHVPIETIMHKHVPKPKPVKEIRDRLSPRGGKGLKLYNLTSML